jgi:(p)ppGpp synthase/HD superfamily hydrolase
LCRQGAQSIRAGSSGEPSGTDEALLNRAYVYAMKATWRAEARLGRSLFLPSARSRRDPDRPAARRRDDRGALTLHDTIEDTDATRAEIDEVDVRRDIGDVIEDWSRA